MAVRRGLIDHVVPPIEQCPESNRSVDVAEPTPREMACHRLAVCARRRSAPDLDRGVVLEDLATEPPKVLVDDDISVEAIRPDSIQNEHPDLSTHLAGSESIPRLQSQIHGRVGQIGDHLVYVQLR
jgi:hypothetical protein